MSLDLGEMLRTRDTKKASSLFRSGQIGKNGTQQQDEDGAGTGTGSPGSTDWTQFEGVYARGKFFFYRTSTMVRWCKCERQKRKFKKKFSTFFSQKQQKKNLNFFFCRSHLHHRRKKTKISKKNRKTADLKKNSVVHTCTIVDISL